VENFKHLNQGLQADVNSLKTDVDNANAETQMAKSAESLARTQAQNEVGAIREQLNNANSTILQQKTTLAENTSRQATDAASIKSTTDALNVAQETVKVLQGQLKELRG